MDSAQLLKDDGILDTVIKASLPETAVITSFDVEKLPTEGFLSVQYLVNAEYINDNVNGTKSIFIKASHPTDHYLFAISDAVFVHETTFYEKVVTELEKRDLAAFELFPKVFKTGCHKQIRYIAMANLKIDGYVMRDVCDGLNEKDMINSLVTLATIHGDIKKCQFLSGKASIVEVFPELAAIPQFDLSMLVKDRRQPFLEFLQQNSDRSAELSSLVEDSLQNIGRYSSMGEGDVQNTFVSLCNTDIWPNNIFFADHENKPTCKIIDWQTVRANHVAFDVILHMINSCAFEYIGKYEHFLRIYYDTYRSVLCDCSKELNFEELLGKLGEGVLFGLLWLFLSFDEMHSFEKCGKHPVTENILKNILYLHDASQK